MGTLTMLKIRFQGNEFLATEGHLGNTPIATEDDYRNGRCSYAHLFSDGVIRRFNVPIGHRDDIEVLEEVKIGMTTDEVFSAIANMIRHPWKREEVRT